MPQFFIEQELAVDQDVCIEGPDAKHIASVLRLQKGETLLLSSGNGHSYVAELVNVTAREVTAHILRERSFRHQKSPTLAQALVKHDKTEWIFQKAVELGVTTILPFSSSRTIPHVTEGIETKKLLRWNHIALEAAKQSGLPFRPEIKKPATFDGLLQEFASYATILFFWEGEEKIDFFSYTKTTPLKLPLLLVIGPEGGFSNDEVRRAKERGAASLSLGPQILRVETASITALAVCQYALGNLSVT